MSFDCLSVVCENKASGSKCGRAEADDRVLPSSSKTCRRIAPKLFSPDQAAPLSGLPSRYQAARHQPTLRVPGKRENATAKNLKSLEKLLSSRKTGTLSRKRGYERSSACRHLEREPHAKSGERRG